MKFITHTHPVEEIEKDDDKGGGGKMKSAAVIAMLGTGAVASVAAARAWIGSGESKESQEAGERQDTLVQNLNDMLVVVRDLHSASGRYLDDPHTDEYPGVQSLFEQVERVFERHIEELEREVHAIGGSVSGVKSTVAATGGALGGIVSRFRQQPVSRMMRDTYLGLSMAAVSYTMLHATARAMERQATADLAQRCLEDVTPLVIRVSEEIPAVVVQEFAAEGKPVNRSAAEQATETTQEAWRTTDTPGSNN